MLNAGKKAMDKKPMNMKEHIELVAALKIPKAQVKKIKKHIESLPKKRESLPGSKIVQGIEKRKRFKTKKKSPPK